MYISTSMSRQKPVKKWFGFFILVSSPIDGEACFRNLVTFKCFQLFFVVCGCYGGVCG